MEAQLRAVELERGGAGAIVRRQLLLLQHAMALGLLPVARMTHPSQAAAVLAAAAAAARTCLGSCGPAARTESATLICITSAGGSDAAAATSEHDAAGGGAGATAPGGGGGGGSSEPGLEVGALSEQRRMVEAAVAVLWGSRAPYTRDPQPLRTVRLLQAVLPSGFLPPPPMPLPDVLADGEYAVHVEYNDDDGDHDAAAAGASGTGAGDDSGRGGALGPYGPARASPGARMTLARAGAGAGVGLGSFSSGIGSYHRADGRRDFEAEGDSDAASECLAPDSRRSSMVGVPDEHAYALGELQQHGSEPYTGSGSARAGARMAAGSVEGGRGGHAAHSQHHHHHAQPASLAPGAHVVTSSMLRAAADAHEEPASTASRQLQQLRVLEDAAAGAFVDAEQGDDEGDGASARDRERGSSVSAEDGGGRCPPGSASSRSNSALPRRARAIASSSSARREQRSVPLGSFADATPMTVRGRMRSRVLAAQASVGSLTEAAALVAVVLCGHGAAATASSQAGAGAGAGGGAASSSIGATSPRPLASSLPPAPGAPLAPWTACSVAIMIVVVPPPPPPVAGGRSVAAARVLATRLPYTAPARIASPQRGSAMLMGGGAALLVVQLPRREVAQEALAQLLRRCPQGARSPLTSLPAPATRTAAGGLAALEELLGGLGGGGGVGGGFGGAAAAPKDNGSSRAVAASRFSVLHAPGTATAAAGGRSFASHGSASHLQHDTLGRASQRALTAHSSTWAVVPEGASAHAVPSGAGASSELLAEGTGWQEPLPELIALPLPRLLQVMVETRTRAAVAAGVLGGAAAAPPQLLVRLVLLQETGRWLAAAAASPSAE